MIILNSNSFNYEIDEYKLNMYKNVKKYNYLLCKSELQIEISDIIIHNEDEYYYIFDCPGEDAFAHWIYESFIFIPIFIKIKLIYPNIKILTNNTKKYVKNFFEFYNITNEIVYTINNVNNICFFSPIISLNDNNINKEIFIKYINLFCDYIHTHINIHENADKNKILFLPRQTVDNYVNRINYGNNDICENIKLMNGTIIDTYELNNIKLQFSHIQSHDIIILDFGSSFFVNSIFQSNKKIIVLDTHNLSPQLDAFISLNLLFNYITQKNNVILIKSTGNNIINFNDIKPYL